MTDPSIPVWYYRAKRGAVADSTFAVAIFSPDEARIGIRVMGAAVSPEVRLSRDEVLAFARGLLDVAEEMKSEASE